MNTYVMSDIHGQYEAYQDVLAQISFETFSKRDKLYILGDVIDRGGDSMKILHHIMANPDKITLLMGNHELMMVESLPTAKINNLFHETAQLWLNNGGGTTCAKFTLLPFPEREKVLAFLRGLPYHKIIQVNQKKYYLVHAMPYGAQSGNDGNSLKNMSKRKKMLWGMFQNYDKKDTTVVFGHRCTAHYDPIFRESLEVPEHFQIYQNDNYIALDCGCAYQNKLSRLGCIRLQDGEKFYGKLIKYEDSAYW